MTLTFKRVTMCVSQCARYLYLAMNCANLFLSSFYGNVVFGQDTKLTAKKQLAHSDLGIHLECMNRTSEIYVIHNIVQSNLDLS